MAASLSSVRMMLVKNEGVLTSAWHGTSKGLALRELSPGEFEK
jgi:hypothetical protein